jgi:hypothetical protein
VAGEECWEVKAASVSAEQKFMSRRANRALGDVSVFAGHCSAKMNLFIENGGKGL